ncbi:L,D-transpeptidase [Gardnerella vaginalis]|uniref:L,D-transpeptidase n=1 Tax=Gardnerella vaginalis TaxID=2702 RepID=UPI001FF20E96|nr:L,D-transpeptidase family protein [Gardnerella vaginalis]
MTDMQHNPEGEDSFNQMPGHTPDDASDDTVAFAQVEQNQVDNQSADNDEKTLAENLGEVADEYEDQDSFDSGLSVQEILINNSADSTETDTFKAVTPDSKSTPENGGSRNSKDGNRGGRGANGAKAGSNNRGNRSALALLYSLLVFVILIAVAFFALQWYFHDRVSPGVNFGDVSVARNLTGYKEDSVKRVVSDAVDASSLVIKDDRGNSITADLGELGVKINQPNTVRAIMQAKHNNLFTRIMPWIQQSISLQAKVDHSAMDSYVLTRFVRERDRAVPYSAKFDKNSESYVVEDGIPGRTIETLSVREAVKKLLAHPGKSLKVSVTSRKTQAPIKRDAAQKLVDELNKLLSKKITFNNGDGKDFTVPKTVLASWITVKADTTRRKLSYTVDTDKADEFLSQALPKELNQQKVNQEDAINKDGKFIFTTMKGSNGVEITYSKSTAEKAVEALRKGNDFKLTLPAKITKFTVEKKLVEMRIVVDKSTQTASVYKNDELVKTFPVCTGRTGADDSTPGTFFIYLRYASQDMRGRNGDGSSYFSPNVRWVSYYHAGEGFHTASWNYDGIATGDAANHGSHGCINMYEQDARWIYENCPRGTIVQIVGTTPDGPVREK